MCIATHLDRNFSIIGGVARSQTRHCILTTKHAISLRLERGLAICSSLSIMHQTQFSEKIPYGGFSQIRSHLILTDVSQDLRDNAELIISSTSNLHARFESASKS